MLRIASLLALVPALVMAAAAAAAANYPEKPITMLVSFAPGGGTDVVARAMVPFLEKGLGGGAKVTVVNRTGAGGEIGYTALAVAPPDGYTIGWINSPSVITSPIERGGPTAWQRMDVLANVVDDPSCFAVHADSPHATLAQLVAYVKANPGAVSIGSSGHGTSGHMALLLFERAAGVKMNHVPYKGSGDSRTALAGKQIEAVAMTIGEAMQARKGGIPMRILGQFSLARTSLAPDLATLKEQGYNVE